MAPVSSALKIPPVAPKVINKVGRKAVVVTYTGPEEIMKYEMEADLNNFRPAERQKEALVEIAGLEKGRVVIARRGNKIIGYVTFHPPEQFERWGQGNLDCILELGAIEVSPRWRNQGISKGLLEVAFANPELEDYIVIATEYYWHWDLRGSGLSVWQYRDLLQKLFGRVGMKPEGTDDPEIISHPANMLMVRVGSRVRREDLMEFTLLRYRKCSLI
ncbi:GNAT family N-acetyltransferase [Calderihabitans maritimus]|uniref:Acetoin dehydrogenase n=1 Tax=Calderihabitans maritimus TaxID=1246530 RepID=A0A1Z5HNV2_9FIRM|nr:GNAT family N-acetyltransferase [Calderihabitans maritimus]GAW91219.1 acetoin dehydrogenase [Calderihabitans maritimus]